MLAFECFADQDLFLFLRDRLGLRLAKRHSYSQGEVINDLLVHDRAELGLVDEDPGASHHRRRDAMPVVGQTVDLETREQSGRVLFIVKPNLERAFLTAMRRLGLSSDLTMDGAELHRRLAQSNGAHADHQRFRAELGLLRDTSLTRNLPTFVTEIETHVRRRSRD